MVGASKPGTMPVRLQNRMNRKRGPKNGRYFNPAWPMADSDSPPTKSWMSSKVCCNFPGRSIESREDADPAEVIARRRKFVMVAVLGTLGVNLLMFLRFFYPRALYEPKARFRIGYPSDLD